MQKKTILVSFMARFKYFLPILPYKLHVFSANMVSLTVQLTTPRKAIFFGHIPIETERKKAGTSSSMVLFDRAIHLFFKQLYTAL